MKQLTKAAIAAGTMDAISNTNTGSRIIDEATKRTEDVAELLEKLEEKIKEEER